MLGYWQDLNPSFEVVTVADAVRLVRERDHGCLTRHLVKLTLRDHPDNEPLYEVRLGPNGGVQVLHFEDEAHQPDPGRIYRRFARKRTWR